MENDTRQGKKHSLMEETLQASLAGCAARASASPFFGGSSLVIQVKKSSMEQAIKKGLQNMPNIKMHRFLFNDFRIFNGMFINVASVPPSISVTFATQNVFSKYLPDSPGGGFASSFGAGFSSGIIRTPFEALVQGQILTQSLSQKEILNAIVMNNGPKALMRGGLSLGVREGAWATSYLFVPKHLGVFYERLGLSKDKAQTVAAFSGGGAFGLLSAPLNVLRFAKQSNLDHACKDKSYWTHTQEIWKRAPKVSVTDKVGFFFHGAVLRSAGTAVCAGILQIGMTMRPD